MAYNKNNLYKTLHLWSRDMFNFDFSEKGLGKLFPLHFVYYFSRKMFLMLYSIDWLYFLRYWSVCALQLFVDQVVMSWILKSTLYFLSSHFWTWLKIQDKNVNILAMGKVSKHFKKHFSSFFEDFQSPKNILDLRKHL